MGPVPPMWTVHQFFSISATWVYYTESFVLLPMGGIKIANHIVHIHTDLQIYTSDYAGVLIAPSGTSSEASNFLGMRPSAISIAPCMSFLLNRNSP